MRLMPASMRLAWILLVACRCELGSVAEPSTRSDCGPAKQEGPADRSAGPLGDLSDRSAYAPSTSARSIFRPGPIDEVSETFLTYLPLAPAGLALTIASVSAAKFALSCASVKLILPM